MPTPADRAGVPTRSVPVSPTAASSGAGSRTSPYDGAPPVRVTTGPTVTGSRPAPHDCTRSPAGSRPRSWSTHAAPTDGWPAKGSSTAGVKIRSP